MLLKIIKITGIVLVLVILLVVGTFAILYYNTATRINKHYSVNPQSISIEGDSVQLAYGARLTMSKGCKDCHGADLGGNVFLDDPGLGRIVAKNLTKGKGGLPEDYDTRDWVRALKHGIKRDGTPLLIMPSHEFTLLTEKDMAAIIAYAQQLPRINRELPEKK